MEEVWNEFGDVIVVERIVFTPTLFLLVQRETRSHEFENGTAYMQYRLHISQVQWARIAASAGKGVDSIKGFVAVSSLQFFEAKRK